MTIHKAPLFQGLLSKMRWLSKRQEVLSGNLTRVDLPGAKAKDLKPFRLPRSSKTSGPSLKRTNGRHMVSPSQKSGNFKVETDRTEAGVTLSGNHISPEDQMRKMNETATDYAKMASLYKNNVKLLRSILRGR